MGRSSTHIIEPVGYYASSRVFVDRVFVDRVFVDRVFVDRVFVDRVFVDRVFVDRVFVDRVFVDRVWEEGWRLIHGFIRNIDREVERNEENKR